MDDLTQRRIGFNEASFREVNEAIAPAEPADDERVAYVCECGRMGCNQLVELPRTTYEHVRSSPRSFFVVPGHELLATEEVVERHERHFVVRKFEAGAEVAEQTDPRR